MDKLLKYFNGDELAASVWKQKYAVEGEETPDDMHRRMAREFARAQDYPIDNLKWNNLSYYGRYRDPLTEEKIYNLFKDFKYIVPQGSVMAILGSNKIGSLSNCFVVGQPYDSYGGIFQKDQELAQLMKRRGGVGGDISTLRPALTPVTNAAGTSSGAVLFMERFSNTTREVAQDGRRGALMLSIDVRHPDVKDFATIKQDLTKVTGANISVQLRDDFMQAVISDSDYILRWPCNTDIGYFEKTYLEDIQVDIQHSYYLDPYDKLVFHKNPDTGKVFYTKRIKARELWNTIIECAHATAEPGLMFLDKHWDYSPDTVYPEYKGITTNPCFRGDMKLLTAEGYKTFKELENLEVDLVNIEGEIVPGTVWSNGVKDVYEITTWGNKKIYCTEDHRFLLADGTEEVAKNLKGKRLMPFYELNYEVNEYTKLGFLQGDGNLTRLRSESHKGLEVNIGEKDKDIAILFGLEHGPRSQYITGYNELMIQLGFSSLVLPERVLPETFSTWPLINKLMFFKGMYSANGGIITNHRVSYKTTCKHLSTQIKDFLSSIGIKSYITTNKEKEVTFSNGQYVTKESYDINISHYESILTFAKKIGFVHSYKQESLNNLILAKSPMVRKVQHVGQDEVFDFNLQDDRHWGVVEGVIAHNCGEIFMGKYDACRLLALNLYSFVKNPFEDSAYFDFEEFYKVAYEQQYLADALVDLEIERVDAIIKKIESDPEPPEVKQIELDLWLNIKHIAQSSRRTGSGFTALGDTLAALGLKYDSDEALKIVEKIMETKFRAELDCTIDLAVLKGPFKGWSNNNEYYGFEPQNSFYKFLKESYPEQQERMFKFGRRNVSWSTVNGGFTK